MVILKRSGKEVPYDGSKIVMAVQKAVTDWTKKDLTEDDIILAENIEQEILSIVANSEVLLTVEDISNEVQELLVVNGRVKEGIAYITYRLMRDNTRDSDVTYKLLSKEFLSNYKHIESPMNQLGNLVYYRTYSRWLSEKKRREYWWETVARAVDYNCSLVPTTRQEAEALYDNVFNLRQFLSGRTFWVGGTDVAKNYPMANFNCSFTVIDNFNAYKDLFYLLMVGSGVGIRVLKDDVSRLPKIRTSVEIIHEAYTPVNKEDRIDSTGMTFISRGNSAKLTVGDSKEGWVQSLDLYLKLLYSNEYREIDTIVINYNNVRPKGEKLKTFGGTASGHISLKNMFTKINKTIKKRGVISGSKLGKLKPIDCLDIANIIGENVVVGGVRRTAEIVLIDSDDQEAIEAKSSLYKQIDGQWIVDQDIIHRQMSNNSIYYKEKPTRERLHWQIGQMRYSGEPAWVNEVAGAKRRPNMNGVNPCGEILLDSDGLCNLTTVNTFSFVNEDGTLDRDGLLEAQKLSARAGYRMTCVELELPMWNYKQNRDKLLGCSLTGWQDMVNVLDYDREQQALLLNDLRYIATKSANKYANEIGENEPILITTVKPEGTLSQLPTVSSGVHYSHSPYYIRRVRINAEDPLAYVCQELGYPMLPEVGQEWDTCTTKVIEFPVKSPKGRTKYDVSAIEQLENYTLFMDNYVQHNCSITVHVRDDEWEAVEEWVWEHWDDVVALSFLSLDDNFYDLLPYEQIEEDEYNKRVASMSTFHPDLLAKYEKQETELDIGTESCDTGACPIR